jgi:N-acetylmuramoyl-L-alanine amidase
MKRIFLLVLFSANLFGWSFFFSEEEKPKTVVRPVTFTLMIDPAGDANDTGRVIDDSYERSLTMQFAEELKANLETNNSGMRVILTRFPGEHLEPLQNASFSNRLSVDLYISLSFFEEKTANTTLSIYTLIYDPATDYIQKKSEGLTLLSYDQAYKESLSISKEYSRKLYEACEQKKLTCRKPLGIPFKPLIGVTAPSLGLEIGLNNKNHWKQLVAPVAQALQQSVYHE